MLFRCYNYVYSSAEILTDIIEVGIQRTMNHLCFYNLFKYSIHDVLYLVVLWSRTLGADNQGMQSIPRHRQLLHQGLPPGRKKTWTTITCTKRCVRTSTLK